MIAALLSTLFTAAGLFAVASIVLTWQRYGAAALAVGDQLRACPQQRQGRWTLRELVVRPLGDAVVVRADFTPRAKRAPVRSAWRAAA
ncbi:MAG: hypothetical protein KGL44_13040 [Sphingomonadales bacterium]|nr:hypothetical protein [Sphingomonadales bacterium]